MIITEIALFVDEKHFDVLIMIHLTTMLVMYTLYQGIQNSVPKAAYLKFMDIFLLFGVIVPFITFMIQVASNLAGGTEESNEKIGEEGKLQKSISSTETKIELPYKIETTKTEKVQRGLKYVAQRLIPIITTVFLSGYSILAVYIYTKG